MAVADIENGIWLCATHADLVDADCGRGYPAEVLRSYKRLHESRVAREQAGTATTFGWLEELEVVRGPVFAARQHLILGKVTVLQGRNGTGKTALCDWIAGAVDPFTVHRWWGARRSPVRTLEYVVRYHAPGPRDLRVCVTQDSIDYLEGNAATVVSPMPFKIVTLREPHLLDGDWRREGEDDLALLARLLHLDSAVVRNALRALDTLGTGEVRNAHLS